MRAATFRAALRLALAASLWTGAAQAAPPTDAEATLAAAARAAGAARAASQAPAPLVLLGDEDRDDPPSRQHRDPPSAPGAASAAPAGRAAIDASTAPAASASASAPAPSAAAPGPRFVRAELPRDAGHHLGDVVTYRALLDWPDGWFLDQDGLPLRGREDRPLELVGYDVEAAPVEPDCARCRWLDLRWQVFKSVRAGEDVVLPPTAVRLRRAAELVTVTLPPMTLALSPLVPWEARGNAALQLRPGWEAVPFEPAARAREAALAAAVAAACGAAWAWLTGRWLPFPGRRPFAAAARELQRRCRETPDDWATPDDHRLLHAAFDRTAGEVLFLGGLAGFVRRHPVQAPLAADIAAWFEASRQACFLADRSAAVGAAAAMPRAALAALARRLAQAEALSPRPAPASPRLAPVREERRA